MSLIDKSLALATASSGMVRRLDGIDYRKVSDIREDIKNIPTIDAVPVIRCMDCKWYGRADKRRFYRGMDCLQKRICTIVPDKDYCSRAERKEE